MNTSHTYHAVFATDHAHRTFRVTAPLDWNAAQDEWLAMDNMRMDGLLPKVKFFEVRQVRVEGGCVRSHDRYDRAKLRSVLGRPALKCATRVLAFGGGTMLRDSQSGEFAGVTR